MSRGGSTGEKAKHVDGLWIHGTSFGIVARCLCCIRLPGTPAGVSRRGARGMLFCIHSAIPLSKLPEQDDEAFAIPRIPRMADLLRCALFCETQPITGGGGARNRRLAVRTRLTPSCASACSSPLCPTRRRCPGAACEDLRHPGGLLLLRKALGHRLVDLGARDFHL